MDRSQNNFAELFSSLLALLQVDSSTEERERIVRFMDGSFDIYFIARYASRHGIAPLLYKRLHALYPGHPLTQQLQTLYYATAQENISISARLLQISEQFRSDFIEYRVLKGPLLALDIYGDITLRQYGDLDILIKEEDIGRALESLQHIGYAPLISNFSSDELAATLSVMGLVHRDTGTLVELHWKPTSDKYAYGWEKIDLWGQSREITLHSKSLKVFGDELNLLYLVLHSSKHLFIRLSWICDLDRYLRTHPDIDWEQVIALAGELRAGRSLSVSLKLANILLRTPLHPLLAPLTDDRTEELARRIIQGHYGRCVSTMGGWERMRLLMELRDDPGSRAALLFRSFFSVEMSDLETMRLPGPLRRLYPLVRIWRLGVKYIRSLISPSS